MAVIGATMLEIFLSDEGKNHEKLTDFCRWAYEYSVSADPDEYLRNISDLLLSLCLDIKISLIHDKGKCSNWAGNLLAFAYKLRDDIDRLTAAVEEDKVKQYRDSAREKQLKLLDSLINFDNECNWTEFASWITAWSKHTTALKPSITTEKTIKILFLAANPTDTTRLRLDQEANEIDRALQSAEFRDHFEVKRHGAVRITEVQEYLLRHKPNVVHFSGHGNASGEIIMESISGDNQIVPVHALSELFRILKNDIRCVVLNACYTEKQALAIAEHIDCVIGMSTSISDEAAISFATAFYRALGFGRSMKEAFNLGCSELDIEGFGEQETPKLLALKRNPDDLFLFQEG